MSNILNFSELVDIERNIVFFNVYDYCGVKGILKYLNFRNHNVYTHSYDDLNQSFYNNVFDTKFNLKKFKKYYNILKNLQAKNDLWLKGLTEKRGKYEVLKFDIKYFNYFDDDWLKICVWRDPVIAISLNFFTAESDDQYNINIIKKFKKFMVDINEYANVICYDDFLNHLGIDKYTDIDKSVVTREALNYSINLCKQYLNLNYEVYNELL